MSRFIEIFQKLVVENINMVYQFILRYLPKVVFSLIILFTGWFFALIFRKIVAKLLKASGLDVISDKFGIKKILESGGIKKNVSAIAGSIFYWIIIFSTFIMVFNTLEFEAGSILVKQVLMFVPKMMLFLVLLSCGIYLGEFTNKIIKTSSRLINIQFADFFGKITEFIIIGITILITLKYLNIAPLFFTEIFIAVLIMLCLIVLVCGKEVISSFISGRFLLKDYKKGDFIEFDNISGMILSIDLVTTKIEKGKEHIIIFNADLLKKIVKKTVEKGA